MKKQNSSSLFDLSKITTLLHFAQSDFTWEEHPLTYLTTISVTSSSQKKHSKKGNKRNDLSDLASWADTGLEILQLFPTSQMLNWMHKKLDRRSINYFVQKKTEKCKQNYSPCVQLLQQQTHLYQWNNPER